MLKMSRKILLLILLSTVFLSTFLLVSGSDLLLIPLVEDPYLPLGNIITWIGIIALPLSIYFGIGKVRKPHTKTATFYKHLLKLIIALAAAWGFVAYGLAGNFATTFKNQPGFVGSSRASEYFWNYNYLVVAAPLVFLLVYGLHRLILNFLKETEENHET